jgi:hypothetical protein
VARGSRNKESPLCPLSSQPAGSRLLLSRVAKVSSRVKAMTPPEPQVSPEEATRQVACGAGGDDEAKCR